MTVSISSAIFLELLGSWVSIMAEDSTCNMVLQSELLVLISSN